MSTAGGTSDEHKRLKEEIGYLRDEIEMRKREASNTGNREEREELDRLRLTNSVLDRENSDMREEIGYLKDEIAMRKRELRRYKEAEAQSTSVTNKSEIDKRDSSDTDAKRIDELERSLAATDALVHTIIGVLEKNVAMIRSMLRG